MKRFAWIAALIVMSLSACQRIETGEVGLRVGFDKTVEPGEIQAGKMPQTIWGDVLVFPVREIALNIQDKQPQTSDNVTLKDFDFTVIYNINPTCVSDLWTTKSRGFHVFDTEHKDWILMRNYMETVSNSAAYKAVRGYEALSIADKRTEIQDGVKTNLVKALTEEKLETCLTVSQVQVKNTLLPDSIVASSANVIKARNELTQKNIEVQTAQKEAERIAALNSNQKALEFMQQQNMGKIADAIAAGKVNTIILPVDFKGMVSVPAAK